MIRNAKILTFILLFIIYSVSYGQDFEVAPAMMVFQIDPGESQSQTLTIRNHSNFKTPFTINFADFIINAEGKKETLKRNTSKNSCTEWITTEKTFFDINPNEEEQIKITMQAPEDDYQARWAMMYIQTAKVQSTFAVDKGIGAGVHLSGRIAVLIYRNPESGIVTDLAIKQLKEITETDTTDRKFKVTVENKGNVIENCRVIFIASDLNTGEEFEFDPVNLSFYPGYPRDVEFLLPKYLPPGEYSLAALLDPGVNSIIKGTRMKETLVILENTYD
jgi:hypothetical protein